MHSESEIRRAIKPLLDKYGQLNTSEVKQRLHEVLTFDSDDLEPSDKRNEVLITQRIGNIVAHQSETIRDYSEGFRVDKSQRPATFTAISGLQASGSSNHSTIVPITSSEIKKRQARAKTFKGRDVDWAKKYEDNKEIGNMGEEFVLQYEIDRVTGFSPNDIGRVLHLSKLQGDGLGYDISSIDEKGNTLRIEVKTTSAGKDTVFYMSKNEKDFFEQYKDDGAVIYRVYDFDKNTRRGKIKVIKADELLRDYKFDPVTFAVTKK